jgi:hypothetical protein
MTLEGWVPVAVSDSAIDWRLLPGHHFTHPFFQDTLRCHHGAPARKTTWEEAEQWVAAHPGMAPAGLVFHMSRCGSTLVAQMLAAVAENRVISEPPAVDHVLHHRDSARLRTIVGALGQPAEAETRYFLKLDCWHIRDYELIREAFPNTPAVFLYRDPLEVIVSQMRNPGEWTSSYGVDREACIAELLGEMMQAALRHSDSLRLVEYTALPDAVFGMFGLEWTPAQMERMRHAARLDAKTPALEFQSDSAAKRSAASDRVRAAAAKVAPLFERLRSATQASRPAPFAF